VATAVVGIPLLTMVGMATFSGPGSPGLLCGGVQAAGPSALSRPAASHAAASIPSDYLALYRQAGADYGIPWTVLAAIGEIESDHGRSPDAGVRSGENYKGAGGPMQFLKKTWDSYGVDGDHDGKKDRYDPADAIPGAANLLKHDGADHDLRGAIHQYNHSWDYVNQVMDLARRYGASGADLTAGPGGGTIEAACSTAAGGLAGYSVPLSAPEKVRTAIGWALAQVGTPYVWGGDCADPQANPTNPHHQNCDCSSLVQQAWAHAGVDLPRDTFHQVRSTTTSQVPRDQIAPGDLLFTVGSDGTAENPGHVGMFIGDGKVVAAPHTGANIRVEPYAQWEPKIVAVRRVNT
jgi:cell wall-associated NlpC family hydrolase